MRGARPHRRARAELPAGSESWLRPWVLLRSATYHPFIYRAMVRQASDDARAGDLVHVYDRHGERFGSGFYNPRSRITLRMLAWGDTTVDREFFRSVLEKAVALRSGTFGPGDDTNTYRVVHAEGDGLGGLVVDRFDDVLSVETFALGIHKMAPQLVPILHELCGTRRHLIRMDRRAAELEGCGSADAEPGGDIRSVRVVENGVRYAVDFSEGQKTGFFCDQRENRKLFADLVAGRTVLDVCCYSGGFSISAMKRGSAREATGVDLDEKAIAQARHNANLNQVRVKWVHVDAFTHLRQMVQAERTWEAIVLDPPKFIPSQEKHEEGARKYLDLNRLALRLVAPGGLFVTCSCSGRLSHDEFEKLVATAARHADGRRLQFLRVTGAGPDHPVLAGCPESRYLKVLWARVL